MIKQESRGVIGVNGNTGLRRETINQVGWNLSHGDMMEKLIIFALELNVICLFREMFMYNSRKYAASRGHCVAGRVQPRSHSALGCFLASHVEA